MTPRAPFASVSLAAFLGGGLLAPGAHLAWHRPDHTHGPDGGPIGLRIESHEPGSPRTEPAPSPHRHAEPVEHGHHGNGHRHPHAHTANGPARHGSVHRHETLPVEGSRTPAVAPPHGPPARAASSDVPPALPHGHGSLAHFGLALLPAPSPLELPAPALAGWAPPAGRTQPVSRRHADFPLPRPPPGWALS